MFAEIWKTFMAAPAVLGTTPGERERWHRGRPRYAVWLLRVSSPEVRARAHHAAAALAPWITVVPDELLHITVLVAGFPTDRVVWNDDIEHRLLAAQERSLADAAVEYGLHGLRLAIGGVGCFTSAAFLEVHDPFGDLARVRQALLAPYAGTGQAEVRFAPFVPHLTVGAFCAGGPVAPVAGVAAPLRMAALLPIAPLSVELVDFDATRDMAGFRTLRAVTVTVAAATADTRGETS